MDGFKSNRLTYMALFYLLVVNIICEVVDARVVLTSQAVDPSFAQYGRERPIPASTTYDIGIVADMDAESRLDPNKAVWTSYLLSGKLTLTVDRESVTKYKVCVTFDRDYTQKLTSRLNDGGRGFELSALHVFNHRLLTCDDRTGIVYDIPNVNTKRPVPFVILNDGNGTIPKGFKCEWETEKDGFLYIGSHGDNAKPPVIQDARLWVKRISADGVVTNWDWHEKFEKVRTKLNAVGFDGKSGYVMHESGVWDGVRNRWVFLPRQVTQNAYNASANGCFGSNQMVFADDAFENITVLTIGPEVPNNPLHGYSAFKFIPNTNNTMIVALKTQECAWAKDTASPLYNKPVYVGTWIMAFDIDGKIILPEQFVESKKYEGIEFL